MTHSAKKYLEDIAMAIDKIKKFIESCPDFNAYSNDDKTKSAVERQLGIVGEAVNLYSKQSAAFEIQNANQIVSLRNRLVHAYSSVDDTIVWAIVQNHLPALKAEIKILLL